MKKIEFCEVMGDINEDYIKSAHAPRIKKKIIWVKYGALVAGFVFVFIAATAIIQEFIQPTVTPSENPNHTLLLPDEQSETITDSNDSTALLDHEHSETIEVNTSTDTSPITSTIHISMDCISINDLDELVAAAPRWYDPEQYDKIKWDSEEIITYFGKDIIPVYTPPKMKISIGSNVVAEKGGKIVADTVRIGYSVDNDEKNTPQMSIQVSKLGLLGDCIYLLPENEVKISKIGDVDVTIGYRSMPYGSYSSETKEPFGYYDLYVAEFTHCDIGYQIVAERMDIKEVIRVVASIIYEKDVLIDN